MNSENKKVRLMSNLQATVADALADTMAERGRGFASDREAWAELKERLEVVENAETSLKKVHKEMWDAVKDHNPDAFCALAQEFERGSLLLAAEFTLASVMGKLALENTGEEEA